MNGSPAFAVQSLCSSGRHDESYSGSGDLCDIPLFPITSAKTKPFALPKTYWRYKFLYDHVMEQKTTKVDLIYVAA